MRRPVVVATSTVSSRAVCQANMPSDGHANVVTGTTYPVPPASRAPNFQVAQPAAAAAPLGRHARPGPGLRLSLVGRETETKAIVAIVVEVKPFRSFGQIRLRSWARESAISMAKDVVPFVMDL